MRDQDIWKHLNESSSFCKVVGLLSLRSWDNLQSRKERQSYKLHWQHMLNRRTEELTRSLLFRSASQVARSFSFFLPSCHFAPHVMQLSAHNTITGKFMIYSNISYIHCIQWYINICIMFLAKTQSLSNHLGNAWLWSRSSTAILQW